jgi:F0F1-type ATP synthase assembly protein I
MKETQKLLDEIKAVKKQAQYERERRNSSNMHSNIGQMQLSQNNMLMLVVVFAIGYMIGNK